MNLRTFFKTIPVSIYAVWQALPLIGKKFVMTRKAWHECEQAKVLYATDIKPGMAWVIRGVLVGVIVRPVADGEIDGVDSSWGNKFWVQPPGKDAKLTWACMDPMFSMDGDQKFYI